MRKLTLSVPVPEIDWNWFTSDQFTGVVRIVFSAGGPGGAWLIHHEGWTLGELGLLTNVIIGSLAVLPPIGALIFSLRSNSKGAMIDKVANFNEVSTITVNTDTITPSVNNPKVTLNGVSH